MSIQDELNQIKTAVYGADVRDAIHDSIKKTYDDASANGNANMEVEMARGTHPNLRSRLDETTAQLAQKADKSQIGAPEQSQIDDWLDRNPNATTTVQDESIGKSKLTVDLSNEIGVANNILSTYFSNEENVIFSFAKDDYVTGKYWLQLDGYAEYASRPEYRASENLYPVQSGDILVLKNWSTMRGGALAYSAYTKNKEPYDYVTSRIDFNKAIKSVDNDFYFIIPEGADIIGLSVSENYLPGALENAYATLESGAVFSDKLKEEIEKTNEEQGLGVTKEIVDAFFKVSSPRTYQFEEGNFTEGAYWFHTDTSREASYNMDPGYIALNDLVPVNSGEEIRLFSWGDIDNVVNLAISYYDNDGKAYDTTSRVNFSEGTYNEEEDYWSFIVPNNVSQVGLSIKDTGGLYRDKAIAKIGNFDYYFSDKMKNEILETVGGTITPPKKTGDERANFFQKGASPKSHQNKLGLIVAGQSNTDGRVPIAELPTEIPTTMANVNYLSNYISGWNSGTFQKPYAVPNLWAYDTVTYHHLTKNNAREIFVMKWSQGGVSIDPTGATTNHWTAEYEKLESLDNSLILKFESLIRAAIESRGSEFDVRAFLWHQGEGDNGKAYPIASKNYYRNLKNVIEYCRGVVGNKNLPFICGTVSTTSAQYDPVVNNAFYQLAEEDPYFYVVEMANAPLRDAYHFDAVASTYLGEKMYDYLIDAKVLPQSTPKINPVRPW